MAFRQKYAGRAITLTGAIVGTYGITRWEKHGLILRGKFEEDGSVYCDLAPNQTGVTRQVAKDQLVNLDYAVRPRGADYQWGKDPLK